MVVVPLHKAWKRDTDGRNTEHFSPFGPDLAVASSLHWVLATAQSPLSLAQPGVMAVACAVKQF